MKQALTTLMCAALLIFGLGQPTALAEETAEDLPTLVDDSFEVSGADVLLVQDGPVAHDPIPSGSIPPSSGTDTVTLLIAAAGGFAVGVMAGVMGCCVLFLAYYY
ncbi:MAG TPA: hypothetical protein QGF58_01765 [Myxococcota bacterium]|nr:hypothetical protein [Myxococcota bacterium]